MKDLLNNLTNENEVKYYDTILENIEDIFTSDLYNTYNLDSGNDEVLEVDKMKVILTTSGNQKKNIYNNMTNIDLGECENSLREDYNISENDVLYIKMIEVFQEGMQIPKIEYDIYSKGDEGNLEQLDLKSCKDNKISLSIPVNVLDDIDKINSSSGYYNDFCYTTTTDSGTDITLKDRKSEFTSKAVCQDDCNLVSYNYTSKKAKCSCETKGSSKSFADMKINKNKLLDNFKNIKNLGNFNILKCFKVLLSKKGILNNVGFFIIGTIIIFHIITLFILCLKQFELLKNKIIDIVFAKLLMLKKNDKLEEKEEKDMDIKEKKPEEKEEKKIDDYKRRYSIQNNIIIMNENLNNIYNEKFEDEKKIKFNKKGKGKMVTKKKKIKLFKKGTNISDNSNNIGNMVNSDLNSDIIVINRNKAGINVLSKKHIKAEEIKKLVSIVEYNDEEINDLSYDLALQNDKRTYWQFYFSLIRTKHEFLYAFFYNKDYNSKIIKIDLFLFGFALNYTVNGFFFTDETMHNVYESKGLFDISYQLPIIIYSSFISMFLGALMQMLGLSSDTIIDFKQSEETNNINEKGEKLIRKLKIKFIFYFILGFLFLFSFLYYISMFGAVYRNTQFLLLKDTIMGFGISLISPFVLYLMPGLFRIPSLNPQKRKKCLYGFSKLFTIL